MEDACWQKTENRRKQKRKGKIDTWRLEFGSVISLFSHNSKKRALLIFVLRLFSTFPMICADFHPTRQFLASPALICLIYYFTFHWLLMNHASSTFLFSHNSKKRALSHLCPLAVPSVEIYCLLMSFLPPQHLISLILCFVFHWLLMNHAMSCRLIPEIPVVIWLWRCRWRVCSVSSTAGRYEMLSLRHQMHINTQLL
jgi:hypothetical protein